MFVECFGEETWKKRQLGRYRRRWENNIKLYLQEVDVRVWTGCCPG
jgi:hypothetical protein